jgi:YD repeat-containing protein
LQGGAAFCGEGRANGYDPSGNITAITDALVSGRTLR